MTAVSISQEVHGLTWRYLGEYYFEAGRAGHVTLLNGSSDPEQAVVADAIRFGGGVGSMAEPGGTSGKPRWEEAAKYWARYQGAPAEVTDYDETSRPLYAEWETAKGYPGDAREQPSTSPGTPMPAVVPVPRAISTTPSQLPAVRTSRIGSTPN